MTFLKTEKELSFQKEQKKKGVSRHMVKVAMAIVSVAMISGPVSAVDLVETTNNNKNALKDVQLALHFRNKEMSMRSATNYGIVGIVILGLIGVNFNGPYLMLSIPALIRWYLKLSR